MMALVVIWGVVAWRRMQKKVVQLRDALPADLRAQLEE
jgi:hypothetical protein